MASSLQNESSNKKIVIFDFDDTLFPTTVLFKHLMINIKDKNVNKRDLMQLAILSQLILSTLKQYLSIYGQDNIFIVTNGPNQWIEQALNCVIVLCAKYQIKNSYEAILELQRNGKIKTISARDDDNHFVRYPKQTLLWKHLTFQKIVKKNNCDLIISIGDSNDEFIASRKVADEENIGCLHRIKLKANPNIADLMDEMVLVKASAILFNHHSKPIILDYAKEKEAHFTKLLNNK